MAISLGQVTAPTTGGAAQAICTVPPGATLTLSTVATTADVFLGTSDTVTSANGTPLDPYGPTTLENPLTGSPFTLYCVAGTGTHVVGYILLTRN